MREVFYALSGLADRAFDDILFSFHDNQHAARMVSVLTSWPGICYRNAI
jgi:hypothetical protein